MMVCYLPEKRKRARGQMQREQWVVSILFAVGDQGACLLQAIAATLVQE